MFYPGKKRGKKEPDAFQKTFAGMFERMRDSGLLLVLMLSVLVVGVAAFWMITSRNSKNEAEATAKLKAAYDMHGDERVGAYEKLAKDSATARTAPVALLEAAALTHAKAVAPEAQPAQRDESLKKARELSEKFLASYPTHSWLPLAHERHALVLEDMANATADQAERSKLLAEAAKELHDASGSVKDTDFAFLTGKLLYAEARCRYALGETDSARQLLEQVTTDKSARRDAFWMEAAGSMLAQLRTNKDSKLVRGAAQDAPPEPEKPAAPVGPVAPKAPEKPKSEK